MSVGEINILPPFPKWCFQPIKDPFFPCSWRLSVPSHPGMAMSRASRQSSFIISITARRIGGSAIVGRRMWVRGSIYHTGCSQSLTVSHWWGAESILCIPHANYPQLPSIPHSCSCLSPGLLVVLITMRRSLAAWAGGEEEQRGGRQGKSLGVITWIQ